MQRILVVDRVLQIHERQNDSWTYPGMLWEFMLKHSDRVSYTDYRPDTLDRTTGVIKQIAPQVDVLLVTAQYDREEHVDVKGFVRDLGRFGKPVILVSNSPYELIVPEELSTVVVCYSLMREGLEAASDFIFGAT